MTEKKFLDQAERCEAMARLQAVLSGKWKILILWYMASDGVQRFGQLQRRLEGITHSTLARQLRELEGDGFLTRQVYPEVPPRVEYRLAERGRRFLPLLHAMLQWSQEELCGQPLLSPSNTPPPCQTPSPPRT